VEACAAGKSTVILAKTNRSGQANSKGGRVRRLLNTLSPTRESSNDVKPFRIRLRVHGDLDFFFGMRTRGGKVERHLSEKNSVKDVIESCGIPHSEVDLILINGDPVDFAYAVTSDAEIDVYPPGIQSSQFREKRLQANTIRAFVADGHLGKLVRDLRLLGIDVACDPTAEDRQLVEIASRSNRALLTRDRHLLMHAAVRHGYYLRSQNPLEQTIEVLRRFDLGFILSPFSRCLRCNALLEPAEKEKVIGQLEPLTKIYYDEFRRCTGCAQVYWSGSHFTKLQKRLEQIRAELGSQAKC
jgi:uncharacterized protein